MTIATATPSLVRARVATTLDPWRSVTLLIAVGLPAIVGFNLQVSHSLTAGMALSIALLPLWVTPARRYVGTGSLAAVGVACLAVAVLLGQWTSLTHAYHRSGLIDAVLVLLGAAAAVGALIWCRDLLPVGVVALSFAAGSLASAVLSPTARMAENPWKFGLGLPVAIGALGLAALIARWWCDLAMLAALAGIGAVSDARSSSALLALAMLLMIWQARPRFPGAVSSALGGLVFLAGLAYVLYRTLEAAILNGFLGSETQQRTVAQIDQSGSLIVGGRPEIGASWALLRDHPLGYGAGIAPNAHDLVVAKTGMKALGYPPDNGYVEHYMFGQGHFELHSLLGDFWAVYGLAGLLLGCLIGWLALRYVGRSIAAGTGSALGYFLAVRVLWDLAFSPVASTLDHLILVVAVIVLPRAGSAVGGQMLHRRPGPVPARQIGTAPHGSGRHQRGPQILRPQ